MMALFTAVFSITGTVILSMLYRRYKGDEQNILEDIVSAVFWYIVFNIIYWVYVHINMYALLGWSIIYISAFYCVWLTGHIYWTIGKVASLMGNEFSIEHMILTLLLIITIPLFLYYGRIQVLIQILGKA